MKNPRADRRRSVAFMLMALIFIVFVSSYFLLKFLFGYLNPFVAVLSDSMRHEGKDWPTYLEMCGKNTSSLPFEAVLNEEASR